jgi:uncharacterized damage-inducible protein DinB
MKPHVLLIALVLPLTASAQSETIGVAAIARSSLAMFDPPKSFILRAAEKMPEEHYAFRPTPDVRTFAELLGHVADGYRLVCGMALGEPPPAEIRHHEKTTTTKAGLVVALRETSASCDRAHEQLAGPRGAEMAKWGSGEHPRVLILFFNSSHAWEHYGNIVTYLRLKGIVPPSSEPRAASGGAGKPDPRGLAESGSTGWR